MKKYVLVIFLFILFPIQLFADGPFLYSLPFNVYLADAVLEKTSEKGIDYPTFEKYLLDDKNELGKKVALISGLEVYFVVNDTQKSYFVDYREKFRNTIEKKYKTTIEDKKVPINYRFVYALMKDYDTESPNIKAYKNFVDENQQSRTLQTIHVFAFNFDMMWNPERKKYDEISNFKTQYEENYFMNFDNFSNDVPTDILNQMVEISVLGSDCKYDVKCLVPDNDNELSVLNTKTQFILNKIANAESLPGMVVSENAADIGLNAFQWIGDESQNVENLKISANQKELINYFIANETYQMINHVDNLSVYFSDLGKTKAQLAKLNLSKSLGKNESKTNKSFTELKKIFNKDNDSSIGMSDGNTLDDLRNLIYYLYTNLQELTKIYTNITKNQ